MGEVHIDEHTHRAISFLMKVLVEEDEEHMMLEGEQLVYITDLVDKGDYEELKDYLFKLEYTLFSCVRRKYPEGEDWAIFGNILYNFVQYESILEGIISKWDNPACCSDKSRYLLAKFMQKAAETDYKFKNKDRNKEQIWVPNILELEDWMELIRGLYLHNVDRLKSM